MNFRREAIIMAVWPLVFILLGLAIGILGPRLFGPVGRNQASHERTESGSAAK
jgi:hypothetical protein